MGSTSDLIKLLQADPALAKDVTAWLASSEAVGSSRSFVAYRSGPPVREEGLPLDLRPVRSCGAATANQLIHGDNLKVLEDLLAQEERFRCVYIDPPFGTEQHFRRKATEDSAYADSDSGGRFLAALRDRVVLLRDLLTEDGSLFLHLDTSMVAEAKLLLDEIFGRSNFRSWVSRRKCSSKNGTRKTFGDITDYILFYSKGLKPLWNRPYAPRSQEQEAIDFPKVDAETGRRFALVPIHAPGRRNGASGSRWRGMLPPAGKHWQWTPEKLDQIDEAGDIYWTRNGTPRRKMWADNSPGSAVPNLLLDYRDPFNQNFAVTGYPTEKNVDLLGMLIRATTNVGDRVLDCYCGSGTTLAAAQKAGREWIGVDVGHLAVALSQRRLADQILQEEGIAGDGFTFLEDANLLPNDPSVGLISEIEFALVESVRKGAIPEIVGTASGSRVFEVARGLETGRRLVAFDHGGSLVELDGYDSSQSVEMRPA
jgi:adenine-specific DNA-methyltransferase